MGLFGPSKKEKVLMAEIERLNAMLSPEQQEIEMLNHQIQTLRTSIANLAATQQSQNSKIAQQNTIISELDFEIQDKKKQLSVFDVDLYVQEYGLYKPTFEFVNSDLYKDKLKQLRDEQKFCIKNDTAAVGATNWEVNGSAAKGRAMVNDNKKLLLRAFNVECDDIVANVRVSNLERSIERITKISEQISKLGKTMSISITPKYIQLKINEVRLALDYQQKKQEEKERQKEIKAQEREEAKVQKEIEEARKKLSKEQKHYENALKIVLTQIEKNGADDDLLQKLLRNKYLKQKKQLKALIIGKQIAKQAMYI